MIKIKNYVLPASCVLSLPEGSKVRSATMNEDGVVRLYVESNHTNPEVDYKFCLIREEMVLRPGLWEFCCAVDGLHIYAQKEQPHEYINHLINEAISDVVQDLLYHNRVDDPYLTEGDIEEAIHGGHLTVNDLVETFRQYVEEEFVIHSDL